jgi:catechol 2,3-dioxygenase-like lactoylglutathione lyase family enzyme
VSPSGAVVPVLRSAMPCFLVPDVARTVAWYQQVLGFKNGGVWGEPDEAFGIADVGDGLGFHFKAAAGAMPELAPPAQDCIKLDAYIRVAAEKIAPLHAALRKAGVRVLGEPRDMPWKQREFHIQDPDGRVLCFGGDLTGEAPAGAIGVAPELAVADPRITAEFLREGLGFERMSVWGEGAYLIAGRGGALLHFRRATSADEIRSNASREVWDAYLWCDGLDELAGEFQRRGVPMERAPMTTAYAMREFDVLDPDGHVLCFGAPTRG